MNLIEEKIIRAVAKGKVSAATISLATRYLAKHEALAARPAPKALVHHAKERKQEEREQEKISTLTWTLVLNRSASDNSGKVVCEACHGFAPRGLEPHHLELGASGRRDHPEVVMALCGDCHRLGSKSAHQAPRFFAQTIVVPWAERHGFALPNRKEYR